MRIMSDGIEEFRALGFKLYDRYFTIVEESNTQRFDCTSITHTQRFMSSLALLSCMNRKVHVLAK